jgi:hypothetical protein
LRPLFARAVTVDVEIAGQTRPFLLDTGAGITVVTPEVARLAGCTPFGRGTGFRHSGERIDVPRCQTVPLRLGPLTLSPEAGVMDLATLGLQGVDGLVALQTLDLTGRRLILETPASLAQRVRGMKQLSVRPSRQVGGASLDYMVEVSAPRGNLWLELDSGNMGPVLLSPHALEQLGVDIPDGESRPVTLGLRGLGPTELEAVRRDTIYDGLLNAVFFEGRLVTFDLPAGRLWVSER